MRELIEVTWEDTDRDDPKMVKEKYWLLFWGMKMEIINGVGVSYSVGICSHYKTGDVILLFTGTDSFTRNRNKEVMTQIKLTVLGEPKAQARHRHFTRGTFSGTYDPSKDKKETFASILQSQAPKEPISDPIVLELMFYMSRPRNHYGSGKKAAFLKDSAPEYHSGRPDLDNLTKFVQDSLNKIFYRDDCLIYQLTAKKLYSETPRTEITITVL